MATPVVGKDVAQPGTTPAQPTSKPVIVGHSSQIADPMVSASQSTQSEKTPIAASGSIAPTDRPKLTPSAEATEAQKDVSEKEKAEADAAEPSEEVQEKTEEENIARAQELIESGEYNVSIAQHTAHGVRTFVLTVLGVVIVGLIALFILTDLKVIDLGIKLPFHIFKQ